MRKTMRVAREMAEHLIEWDASGNLTRCPDRAVCHVDFFKSVGMRETPAIGQQVAFHGVTFSAEYVVMGEPQAGWVPLRKIKVAARA